MQRNNLMYQCVGSYKWKGNLNANTPNEHQDTVFSKKLPEHIKHI